MLSVADLRARDVLPTWQEAVAVVQELLQSLAAAGHPDRVPPPEFVALIPSGEVVGLSTATPPDPVRRAAVLLGALLDEVPAPAELQALVAENLAVPPRVATVQEFSAALAFFERPGRQADVERFIARALAADERSQAEEELRRLKLKALESQATTREAPEEKAPRKGKRSRLPLVAVAVVVLAVAAAAAMAWFSPASTRDATGEVAVSAPEPAAGALGDSAPSVQAEPASTTAPATTGASAAPAPVASGGAAVEGSFLSRTTGRITEAIRSAVGSIRGKENAAPAPAAAAAAPSTQPVRSRPKQAAPAAPQAPAAADLTPLSAELLPAVPELRTIVTGADTGVIEPASIARTTDAAIMVYTAADESVQPAIIVRPVLPASPPPGIPPDKVGTIELVIDENGDVEHVRLVSPMNRYHDRMLVSHAKSWKFQPAMRGGQPVKFRTRVRVTI